MNVEIQVALNFIISYLFNKLPRRRINIFAEELERGLKRKFQGHWYPQCPPKGSGYRCVRIGKELDPVMRQAAYESGLSENEIKENLPKELAVWIDPGEVSYLIGDKGPAKIMYSESNCTDNRRGPGDCDKDVSLPISKVKAFNPEAQTFKPISDTGAMRNGSISPQHVYNPGVAPSVATPTTNNVFIPRAGPCSTPQFTAASFAQTKFGSTKMKNVTPRKNLQQSSPTDFNQVKQRNMIQAFYNNQGYTLQSPRSISPSFHPDISPFSIPQSLTPPRANTVNMTSPIGLDTQFGEIYPNHAQQQLINANLNQMKPDLFYGSIINNNMPQDNRKALIDGITGHPSPPSCTGNQNRLLVHAN